MTTPDSPQRGFDPEAEQEVDFAAYARLLAVRWWLLAAGVVVGAVIGYLVSLGGTQVYSATANVYLGQPTTASGNAQLQTLNTNPSAVGAVVNSLDVDQKVAGRCQAKVGEFKKGIATQTVTGYLSKNGQSPLVKVVVQTKKGKVAACAANALAEEAVKRLGTYAVHKITLLQGQISFDNEDIKTIQAAIAGPTLDTASKLILQTTLRTDQQDKIAAEQLLVQAKNVEAPRLIDRAVAHRVTARNRRNTVVVAALIGLILGALAALLWESVERRLRAA